jgi:hypothetical protein
MKKLIVDIAKKANKKIVDKIARSRELKAGVSPADPRTRATRARIRREAQRTAKNIYKGTAAGTGVTAVGGGTAAARGGSKPKVQASKPKPKPTPPAKPKGKAFNVAGLRAAYKKAITAPKPKAKAPLGPKNKPNAKKVAKKTTKSRFDKMTQFQINRLRGKDAAAYKKYKKGKKQ